MRSSEVHKFGGASVQDAAAIRKVAALLDGEVGSDKVAVVVVSAMGKTTNQLEQVWESSAETRRDLWNACLDRHQQVAKTLGLPPEVEARLLGHFDQCWEEAAHALSTGQLDAAYDAFVAAGELASTVLVHGWLSKFGFHASWWDARETLSTNGKSRFARVDESELVRMGQSLRDFLHAGEGRHIVVTQGFIGRQADGSTSTLGREGSDYSASLLAVAIGANAVTIWKDVPGMMNADPKRHPEAVTVPQVDHAEALELSYYGASVIHPRTIKPLQQAGLPLYVRSFVAPDGPFTHIDAFPGVVPERPMFIWRENQMWLEIFTADRSFVAEDHLTALFAALDSVGLHVRLMQQSATHFGLLMDRDDIRLAKLESTLHGLHIQVSHGLTLLTVRHGNEEWMRTLTGDATILVEQQSGATWRRVLG